MNFHGTDDAERIAAVRGYGVLDTTPEGAFDRITAAAAKLFSAPVAVISFVDADRIWFKARHGLEATQIMRDQGLWAAALQRDHPWSVSDIRAEKSLGHAANIDDEIGLRFYAGAPLKNGDGHTLGALCVIDRKPRDISGHEFAVLQALAETVVDQLELRLTALNAASNLARTVDQQRITREIADKLDETSQLMSAIVESSNDAIVSKDLNGIVTSWNHGAEMILGYSAKEMIGQPITKIIPGNRIDDETYIFESIRAGERIEHFETVRRHKDDRLVDMSLTISPIRAHDGRIIGVSKIGRNISERKENENRIRMLMREVNHRVKNQFAVIISMVRETNKRATSPAAFETEIRARIMALSRSHDLLVEGEWRGAGLKDLALAQLKPFGEQERISFSGPEVVLSAPAVQYLGIAFHELATNSAKHGALSSHGGSISVEWTVSAGPDPRFRLVWTERDGPEVGDISHNGFGRVMLERVTPSALNGTGHMSYQPNGIVWTLDAPMTYVGADTEVADAHVPPAL